MSVLILALAAAAAAPPPAASPPLTPVQSQPPERIALPVVTPCGPVKESDTEAVVCGQGAKERFRIDPTTLTALRSREKKYTDQALGRSKLFKDNCNPVGLMAGCATDVLPVLGIAMKAVNLVATAVKGEDLRPLLKAEPSDYDRYQEAAADAKAREDAALGLPTAPPKP